MSRPYRVGRESGMNELNCDDVRRAASAPAASTSARPSRSRAPCRCEGTRAGSGSRARRRRSSPPSRRRATGERSPHRVVVGGLQVGDVRAREGRSAVGRAERDHRARQRLLAAVVARDDDEVAVREDDRLGADEDRARAHRRRPRHAAVVRELAHRDAQLVVGVLEVAAAFERARGAVVARDPLLVEDRPDAASTGADQFRRRSSARRRRASRRARSSACSRARPRARRRTRRSDRTRPSPEPGGVAFTVVPGRKARVHVRPASREIAVPMFDAAPFSPPADLEDRDHRVAPREAVRLDRGLVLAVGVRVRVDARGVVTRPRSSQRRGRPRRR